MLKCVIITLVAALWVQSASAEHKLINILVIPLSKGLDPRTIDARLQKTIEASVQNDRQMLLLKWDQTRSELLATHPANINVEYYAAQLVQARELYLAQKFDIMKQALLNTEQKLLQFLTSPRRSHEAAALNRLLGVANAMLDNRQNALERFHLALRLSLTDDLDPTLFPPKVVALFNEAREEIKAAASFDLVLELKPRSEVILNGKFRGFSPEIVHIKPGLHYLLVRRLGYKPFATVLRVDKALRQKISLPKLPLPKRLKSLTRILNALEIPSFQSEQLLAISEILQVDKVLFWHLESGRRIQSVLVNAKSLQRMGVYQCSRGEAGHIWQSITNLSQTLQRTQQITSSPEANRMNITHPIWKRWWFWAIGGVLVGGLSAGAVWVIQREPVIEIRVQ